MKISLKKTSLIALILGFITATIFFTDYVFNLEEEKIVAHVYGNPSLPIERIDLHVFYAVPSDKDPYVEGDLEPKMEKMIEEVADFHKNQFLDKSVIDYKIHPEPFILEDNGFSYDTAETARGNPNALKSITLEIERRVFDAPTDPESFRVIAIIYEGLGAAGTEGSLILSRDFVSRDEYAIFRPSLFYHEFGHAIGIPEGYDIETGQAFTNDIMGAGRREPINSAYIDKETLKQMGVF